MDMQKFKFTCEVENEYREKIATLKNYFGVSSNAELFRRMVDFFIERDKQDRLDKLELMVMELSNRLGWLEAQIR